MRIELVKAIPSDAEAIHRMQIQCFTPLFELYNDIETSPVNESLDRVLSKINYEKGSYFKLMADDMHVGCIRVFEKAEGQYRVGIIYVIPEFQGKGIGQKALELVEDMYPSALGWELDCPSDMAINRRCYEKAGFSLTGETKEINERLMLVYYYKKMAR